MESTIRTTQAAGLGESLAQVIEERDELRAERDAAIERARWLKENAEYWKGEYKAVQKLRDISDRVRTTYIEEIQHLREWVKDLEARLEKERAEGAKGGGA